MAAVNKLNRINLAAAREIIAEYFKTHKQTEAAFSVECPINEDGPWDVWGADQIEEASEGAAAVAQIIANAAGAQTIRREIYAVLAYEYLALDAFE